MSFLCSKYGVTNYTQSLIHSRKSVYYATIESSSRKAGYKLHLESIIKMYFETSSYYNRFMIEYVSLRELKIDKFDQIWCVTRSKKSVVRNSIRVECLAPSIELFNDSQTAKKEDRFNKFFEQEYVSRYLDQIRNDHEAMTMLQYLKHLSDSGQHCAIVCFCKDEKFCHRSLIKQLVESL